MVIYFLIKVFIRHLVAQPLSLSPLTLALARDIAFPRLGQKAGEQRLHIYLYKYMYISIHICTKVGSDRFKVGICSGRFGSLQGRIKSPKVGSRSGRSDPPTSPSLFVPGPRADVYAEGRPQRGASEAHVGYRIRNNSSSSNSNSSNIIFMLIMIIEMPIIYRADASPGWGSNFPRALPQGGEATSPGYFPRVGKQLPQGTSPGSFPRPGEPNPQVG